MQQHSLQRLDASQQRQGRFRSRPNELMHHACLQGFGGDALAGVDAGDDAASVGFADSDAALIIFVLGTVATISPDYSTIPCPNLPPAPSLLHDPPRSRCIPHLLCHYASPRILTRISRRCASACSFSAQQLGSSSVSRVITCRYRVAASIRSRMTPASSASV